jgi:hypoxanthine phosphoribosyltransferase
MSNSHPWRHDGVVLLVDDVYRTGKTFETALERIDADGVTTAVLYVDYGRKHLVHGFAFAEPGVWYMSPWERVEPFTTQYATS